MSGQGEMAEVVDTNLLLEAILCQQALRQSHDARIVDQDVDYTVLCRSDLLSKPRHRT